MEDIKLKTYYAIFSLEDGFWVVRFPDVPAANTQGRDLDDAKEMAEDALSSIVAFGNHGREYSAPRSEEEIRKQAIKGDKVFPVMVPEKMAA